MAVLSLLVRNANQVVSRESFASEVWQGRVTVEENLTRCISELRKVFKDDNKQPTYIKTIHKKGYQLLVTPVIVTPGSPHPQINAEQAQKKYQNIRRYLAVLVLLGVIGLVLFYHNGQTDVFDNAGKNNFSRLSDVRQALLSADTGAETVWQNPDNQKHYVVKTTYILDAQSEQPRILAKIIDESERVIWQTSYTDGNAINRIAATEAITEVLTLLKLHKHGPELVALQSALRTDYQQALFLIDSRGQDNLAQAILLLDKIIAQQPDFIMAIVQKAVAIRTQSFYQPTIELREQKNIQYKLLLKQAQTIDSAHPVVVSLNTGINLESWNWREYEGVLEKAVEYTPSCTICVRNLAEHYLNLGHYQRAATLVRKHLEFFPLSIMMHSFLGQICNMQGDTGCSSQQVKTINALGQSSGSDTLAMELNIAMIEGDIDQYRALSTAMVAKHPAYANHKLATDALVGQDYAAFLSHIESMPRLDFNMAVSAGKFTELIQRIRTNVFAGNLRDLRLLHGWLSPETHLSTYYPPRLRELKYHPEIAEILADIGLIDFWQETNYWPDYCTDAKYAEHSADFCS